MYSSLNLNHTSRQNSIGFIFLVFSFIFFNAVAAQPVINGFNPASGPVGTTVVINGKGFSSTPGNNIVFFGAVKAQVTAASASSLTVKVPTGATLQPVTVTVNNLTGYAAMPFMVTFTGAGAMDENAFSPAFRFETGLHPNEIVACDFDGDGKPDLAAANNFNTGNGPSSVSVFRNTSSPAAVSFAPHYDYITGTLTFAIAAGDVTGDGKPDMIISSIVDKTISVFKNTSTPGNISFADKIDFAAGDNPFSIAISDLNADGKPDLAVANFMAGTVSIFKNTGSNGAVSFAAKVDIASDFGPYCIVASDLDGDGKPDLAVTNNLSNTVTTFKNTSSGGAITFAAKKSYNTAGGGPERLAVGDVDGDGKPDIVVADNGKAPNYVSYLSILRNSSTSGNISFVTQADIQPGGANASGVSFGDFNGNGTLDMFVPSSNAMVFENSSTTGNIQFSPRFYATPFCYAAAICDIDGDGKPDIVGANSTNNYAVVLRNRINEPVVTGFTPASVDDAGAVVNITGVNFTNATAVSFGQQPASTFTVNSSTSITATVGDGNSGNVSVTTAYGTGMLGGFAFAKPPVITSFTPTSAGAGDAVTITGKYLSGATNVSFGGVPVSSFTVTGPSTISAVVAAGASGDVEVTTPYGTATSPGFEYKAPSLSAISPTSAAATTTVTITGKNLATASAVTFGQTPAISFTVVSSTTIKAVVSGGTSGNVAVTTLGGIVSIPGFTFIKAPPPVITGFAPANGMPGSIVTITGKNFNTLPENNAVYFGTVKVKVVTAATDKLTVVVPFGAASQPVSVTNTATFLTATSVAPYHIIFPGGSINANTFNRVDVTLGTFNGLLRNLADLDNNGRLDIITQIFNDATVSTDQVQLSRNMSTPGHISFPGVQTFDINGTDGATQGIAPSLAADMDGDGKTDLVSLNYNPFYPCLVSVLRKVNNTGAVLYSPHIDIPGGSARDMLLIDIDGDGRTDIAPSNEYVTFPMKNTSTPGAISFLPHDLYAGIPGKIIGDMDGDGKPDILLNETIDNIFSIVRNTSTTDSISFGLKTPVAKLGYEYYPKTIADDLDGDGKLDMIVTNSSPTNKAWIVLRNAGSAVKDSFVTLIRPLAFSSYDGATGDIDGDGKPDVILLDIANQSIAVLKNTSTPGNISFAAPVEYATANDMDLYNTHVFVGDVDGDGRYDVVLFYDHTPNISVYLNKSGKNLPLTLTNFNARLKGVDGILQWQTAAETNTGYFEVQRSLTGLYFSVLGNVKAAGTSNTPENYSYIDAGVAALSNSSPMVYYRLKMVDTDGRFTYSNIVPVSIGRAAGALLAAYPNPAKEYITVKLPATAKAATVLLTDVNGRIHKTITATSNQAQVTLPVTGLAKGLYTITWTDGTKKQSTQVIVQ